MTVDDGSRTASIRLWLAATLGCGRSPEAVSEVSGTDSVSGSGVAAPSGAVGDGSGDGVEVAADTDEATVAEGEGSAAAGDRLSPLRWDEATATATPPATTAATAATTT